MLRGDIKRVAWRAYHWRLAAFDSLSARRATARRMCAPSWHTMQVLHRLYRCGSRTRSTTRGGERLAAGHRRPMCPSISRMKVRADALLTRMYYMTRRVIAGAETVRFRHPRRCPASIPRCLAHTNRHPERNPKSNTVAAVAHGVGHRELPSATRHFAHIVICLAHLVHLPRRRVCGA